ncbi:MAG TPA: hypothetical protein VLK22_03880 [Candidatus Udaeobacter sp.]|nr:hypothetical protein [Candidatus Udaeobacter sp.]
MFKHKPAVFAETVSEGKAVSSQDVKPEPDLKELMEKNLKWSQIIYEQNRKINNKLLWSAIADWLRLLVLVVPIVLAFLFLPPWLKGFWSRYGDLLVKTSVTSTRQNSLENLLKLFNLDPAKQEQLKTLLK